jgi:hypothetical protein
MSGTSEASFDKYHTARWEVRMRGGRPFSHRWLNRAQGRVVGGRLDGNDRIIYVELPVGMEDYYQHEAGVKLEPHNG